MRGERVIVRSYDGRPLVRRVWGVIGNTVMIMAEEEYQKMLRGEDALMPVGFPIRDVFEYDQEVAAIVEAKPVVHELFDWSKLVPWSGSNGTHGRTQ